MLYFNMLIHNWFSGSSIRAVRASERLLAGVNSVVVPKMAFVTEFLVTQRTGVCHGRISRPHVIWQLIERYYVGIWFFEWGGSKRQGLNNTVRNACMLVEVERILWSPGHSLAAVLVKQIVWRNFNLWDTEKRNLILQLVGVKYYREWSLPLQEENEYIKSPRFANWNKDVKIC